MTHVPEHWTRCWEYFASILEPRFGFRMICCVHCTTSNFTMEHEPQGTLCCVPQVADVPYTMPDWKG